MYFAIKHLHLLLIGLAVLMFMLRFYWLQTGSSRAASARTLRLSGWLNGLVVLSGVLLCMVLDLNPLNNATPWLSEKLTAILVVAFLAMMALRLARSNGIRWFAFLGALGWLFFIAKLAVYKQASLFG
ncbi:TPA: SirB2 family protein [Aeromonas dhakensis]|uniref:SirB2 family protein n=1 Tax=Aeromonas TaxID=642 RepID=UPI00029B056B|nr:MULTISPECIES: SirB2 family protein [Aeromonas]AHV34320.1 invasion protein [Aeromonas hydrophila YL17]KMK95584.1 invasion protein [Aeromonas enteropelogenes]ASX11092.1 invasion protein [Aeromonas dhakensis]MBL0602297.1 SirB2 family protein [Aeromonas dhakensis]MBL0620523.1 SirB2 family protein [Aeromonas dhakensis]